MQNLLALNSIGKPDLFPVVPPPPYPSPRGGGKSCSHRLFFLWERAKTFGCLIPLLLTLTACGFQPVYGVRDSNDKTPTVTAQLNTVAIANIPDRDGQLLRNQLIDAFYSKGRPASTAYTLSISLHKQSEDLGVQVDSTTTRSRLTLTADYTLTDKAGKKLFASTARSIAGYNKLTQQYSIETARQNATARTLNEIGNQIINTISLYLAENTVDDYKLNSK